MIEINLLPEEERKRKRKEAGLPALSLKVPANLSFFVGLGAAVVLLVVVLILHFSQVGSIKTLNTKISEKKAELKKLQEEVAKVETMKQKEELINKKIQTIKTLIVDKFAYAKTMDVFSQSLPDYLWIDELTIKSKKVVIKGRTFSNLMITDFMMNLKKQTDYFDAVTLKVITNKPEGGYDIISFEINCTYKQ